MQSPLSRFCALAALLGGSWLWGASPLAAQVPPAVAASTYTGPRYPGGPDSLRAALQRLANVPDAPATGELFIQLQLDKAGRLRDVTPLNPPKGSPAVRLTRQQAQALDAKLAKWPAWQLTPAQSAATPATMILPLVFGLAAVSPALAYADQEPAFAARSLGQSAGAPVGSKELLAFLQRQVIYPAEALRRQERGRVYAYFELSETGAVEHRRVIGSAGPTLDAEVQRVLRLLPPALTPPKEQGRPVRVFYAQPITFSIN